MKLRLVFISDHPIESLCEFWLFCPSWFSFIEIKIGTEVRPFPPLMSPLTTFNVFKMLKRKLLLFYRRSANKYTGSLKQDFGSDLNDLMEEYIFIFRRNSCCNRLINGSSRSKFRFFLTGVYDHSASKPLIGGFNPSLFSY